MIPLWKIKLILMVITSLGPIAFKYNPLVDLGWNLV